MVQPLSDGIRSQAGSKRFRNCGLCCLPDRVGRAARRTPELLQSTMNQAAEKLLQSLGEARHYQLLTVLFQRRRTQLIRISNIVLNLREWRMLNKRGKAVGRTLTSRPPALRRSWRSRMTWATTWRRSAFYFERRRGLGDYGNIPITGSTHWPVILLPCASVDPEAQCGSQNCTR